jgi:hypothetical protein
MQLDMIRKTSLLRKIEPTTRRSSFVEKELQHGSFDKRSVRAQYPGDYIGKPQIALQIPIRIDLLFTMSEIPQAISLGISQAK